MGRNEECMPLKLPHYNCLSNVPVNFSFLFSCFQLGSTCVSQISSEPHSLSPNTQFESNCILMKGQCYVSNSDRNAGNTVNADKTRPKGEDSTPIFLTDLSSLWFHSRVWIKHSSLLINLEA